MTWTRYKQGKLFKTQINDPTVQGCSKCLVLLAKCRRGVAAESTYEMAGCHFKVFYGKPDIYIYVCVCI